MLTYESTLRFSHPRDASHLLAINRFLKRGVRSGICFVCLSYAEAQPAFAAKQQRKYAPLFSPSRRLASARYKSFFEERGKKRHLLRKRGVRSGICFVALGREVLMGIGTGNKKSGSLEPLFLYLAIDYSAGAIASFGQTEAQVPQSVH